MKNNNKFVWIILIFIILSISEQSPTYQTGLLLYGALNELNNKPFSEQSFQVWLASNNTLTRTIKTTVKTILVNLRQIDLRADEPTTIWITGQSLNEQDLEEVKRIFLDKSIDVNVKDLTKRDINKNAQ